LTVANDWFEKHINVIDMFIDLSTV